jgi:mRNA interferase MazF
MVERGQLYFVYLDPVFGRELGGYKVRPVVVLSINDINSKPLTVTVVPDTTAGAKPVHFRNIVVVEPSPENGLTAPTIFECHQIRALDQGRFTSRLVGRLSVEDLRSIEKAIKYSLGFF